MYLGLTLSLTAHILLLGWALVSFQSTPPLKLAEPEPVEVALISPDELVRLTKGDRSSKNLETRAAKQAETPPEEKESPRAVVRTAPPPPSEPPPPDPIADKIAALKEPPPPPKGPSPEEIAKKEAEEALALKQAEEAKKKAEEEAKRKAEEDAKQKAEAEKKRRAEERRKRQERERERQRKLAEKKRKEEERKKFETAQLKALLNKIPNSRAPEAGSADSSADPNLPRGARAGAPEGQDSRLTASQKSMIGVMMKSAVRECWNINSGLQGIQDVVVEVEVRLKPDGHIDGTPRVVNSGRGPLFRDASDSAKRALLQCQPYRMLPPEYYKGGWDFMIVEFDPRKMF